MFVCRYVYKLQITHIQMTHTHECVYVVPSINFKLHTYKLHTRMKVCMSLRLKTSNYTHPAPTIFYIFYLKLVF